MKWRKTMFTEQQLKITAKLMAALLAGTMLLTACAPFITIQWQDEPTAILQATAAPLTAPVETLELIVDLNVDSSPEVSMVLGGVAANISAETIPAVTEGGEGPYWGVLPEHTRLTFQGYPVSSHLMQPQIFIYPVQKLAAVNEAAGQTAAALNALLQAPQEAETLPFMPQVNAAQVLNAHVQFMDIGSGSGLRYLVQFSQAIVPINNYELIYTFQGLTSDGKYYVAAMLPVTHPSLPADGKVTGNEPPEFTSDFNAYLANTAAFLNSQPAESFTPNLTLLDAMISSIEIK